MAITYKLQSFEGPLDLLLHLIDINKVDIYDIPISLITDQYLAYIREMEEENMDITSEFLVMAATLLNIKSRMLLPVEQKEALESGEDPRAELVERLLEYKMFKYIGQERKDQAFDASHMLYKEMTLPEDMVYTPPPVDLEALVGDTTISKLHAIYQEVMRRQRDKIDPIRSQYGTITQEPVKLSDKMNDIRKICRNKKKMSFRGLLEGGHTKEDVIVTFLAILELMRDGTVRITQEALFDDIMIETSDEKGMDEINE